MSTQNLSLDDIRARRRELAQEDKELADIESRLASLASRWTLLRNAIVHNLEHPERVKPSLISAAHENLQKSKAKTKNSRLIEALEQPRPLWQTANQIREYVVKTGTEMKMSSVSPALTALKNGGDIVRRDMHVALTLRVEKEEPEFFKAKGPEAETSEPSQ